MRTISVLGSTGSVGDSTFEVLPELEATHRVVSLVGNRNAARIVEQARAVRPEVIGLADEVAAEAAARELEGEGIRVIGGRDAAVEVLRACPPDLVVAAITGAAGLPSSLEAIRLGATLALANKEALVMAGHLITREARARDVAIVPVDSEHSAIFQSLHGEPSSRVRRLLLTASGGPFFDLPRSEFANVTPERALRHPTWEMGRKITIDSATMMNKALEIIEARWLFDVPSDRIDVLVHRQSIVHSMVEFVDGSIIAQLGVPSMTVPIRYALSFPDRATTQTSYFDLGKFRELTFAAPDPIRFPALDLGHRVAAELGLSGTVLNAANEVAVEWFLDRRASFDRIPHVARHVLDRLDNVPDPSLDEILDADRWARQEAERCLKS